MKLKLLIFTVFFANSILAQNNDAPPTLEETPKPATEGLKVVEKTYEIFQIEKQPSFPGGESELMNFLAQNIKYPKAARNRGLQGTVLASFIVNKDGSISDVRIVRDIGRGCGKEVERVLGRMPNWIPGMADGYPVKVRFTLPVKFSLN